MTERIGFWIDLDDAYYTLTNDYIESVWWSLRQIWDTACSTRASRSCPTARAAARRISSHEMAQGYKDVNDPSVYVRFPLTAAAVRPERRRRAERRRAASALAGLDDHALDAASATSPSRRAPEVDYALVESRGERFVAGRDLVETVLGPEADGRARVPGRELLGLDYEPPFDFVDARRAGACYVVGGDYVTTTTAPASCTSRRPSAKTTCASASGQRPAGRQPVDADGRFVAAVDAWARVFVKDADPGIIADLEAARPAAGRAALRAQLSVLLALRHAAALLRQDDLVHPHHRGQGPAARRQRGRSTWYPEHIKHGRFGEWLENNVDWALSRDRYWGTPLPIWRCEQGHTHCVGSVAELRELAATPPPDDLELHRPYVDDVVLRCPSAAARCAACPR